MISNRKRSNTADTQFSTTSSYSSVRENEFPLESISRVRKSLFSIFQQTASEVISPLKKISVQEFIQKTKYLLEHFHKEGPTNFYASAMKFLSKDWMEFRPKINERLNKIIYLQPTLKYKTYSEIQSEIIKEWKKNHILYALQTLWFNSLLKNEFQSLTMFKMEYERQQNFVAQLAYIMSAPYFIILEEKKFPVLDRLIDQTATFIITSYGDWNKVYQTIIRKLYNKSASNSQINYEFDLTQLCVQEHVIDLNQDVPMPKTAVQIRNFVDAVKITEKISILKNLRKTMEEEIIQNQNRLIAEGKLDHFKTIEKDDFLSCLICCIVRGKIQNVGLALELLQVTLGGSMSEVLSRWKVDSYRADLESAHQYLALQNKVKNIVEVQLKEHNSSGQFQNRDLETLSVPGVNRQSSKSVGSH